LKLFIPVQIKKPIRKKKKVKVIKLIFHQPVAHYRIGFTQQHLHRTLPLPPPSTILGMLYTLWGCPENKAPHRFDIAICGNYESIFYQYQLFRNIEKLGNPAYREAHWGLSMPNQVQLLFNVYLRIYLKFDPLDQDATRFIEAISNPRIPFYIGRREDMAVLENIEIKEETLTKSILPERIGFNYWLSQEQSEKYDLHGPVYLLGTYYHLEEGIRNFKRQRFCFIEPQPINPVKEGKQYKDPEGWIDTDEIDGKQVKIPVFFLGINS